VAWHQQKAALFLLVAVHAMEEGVQFADRDRRDRTVYLVLLSGQGTA
jgi:hypothetical protein